MTPRQIGTCMRPKKGSNAHDDFDDDNIVEDNILDSCMRPKKGANDVAQF